MNALFELGQKVQERVREHHGDVIARVLDKLEERVSLSEAQMERCSYAASLALYTSCKINIHHLMRQADDLNGQQGALLEARATGLAHRAKAVRDRMYSAVCLKCPTCLSRKKQWPVQAVGVDGKRVHEQPWTPLSMMYGESPLDWAVRTGNPTMRVGGHEYTPRKGWKVFVDHYRKEKLGLDRFDFSEIEKRVAAQINEAIEKKTTEALLGAA